MKKIIISLLVLALCLPLSACKNEGTINNADIDYGSSTKFSEDEIKSAVDAVLIKFEDFKGCDLRRIWYDEDRSNTEIVNYLTHGQGKINGAKQENVIILFSDYYVDSSGADASLNPDYTYTDWKWIIVRGSANGKWVVDDWGY